MKDMNCENCRYWSDKLAQAIGGPVEAVCLVREGPHSGRYTPGSASCDKWEDAPLGPVDSGSDTDPVYGNPYEDQPDEEPAF